jgi:hypothetical protein
LVKAFNKAKHNRAMQKNALHWTAYTTFRPPVLAALSVMTMGAIEEFWSIAEAATKKINETYNAPDVIPYGICILDLIERNPDKRSQFADAFFQLFIGPSRYEEALIEFCMHVLRWPEVKTRFEALSREAIEKEDWNNINPLQHILEAFEDDWEDASDFYVEYFGEQNI